jgi:integrase
VPERLLSDRACKSARPREAIYYRNDGNGLRLQVRPSGAKYWMLRYTLAGRESTYQVGTYPEVSLEEARQKAAQARKLVAEGVSPSVDRKVRRVTNIARGEATFGAIAQEWLARHQTLWSSHHLERNEGLLRRILLPSLGRLPIDQISEQMLLKPLLQAYESGTKESARRARAVAAQVFTYAKDTHRASHNPGRELAGSSLLRKPEVKHFSALQPPQVGPLLRAMAASRVDHITQAGLQLMLYTGLRDGALRGAQWQEIDVPAAVWTVPQGRMKSGREHRLPLPRQAVELVSQLGSLTYRGPTSFVFSSWGKAGYLAENTLRLALHGLGFKVTAHGFRSLLTDLLNEHGFNPDAIERQLDHAQRNQVRAAYLRTDFLEYRRGMMQWVADWAEAQALQQRDPPLPVFPPNWSPRGA